MAQWVDKNNEPSTDQKEDLHCSNCGKLALGFPFWECDIFPSLYCPHCGEKMENGIEY